MDSRIKKIQLLKGLLNKTRKIDEILPWLPPMIFHCSDVEPNVYTRDGKTYTKAEVDKLGENPRQKIIIIERASRSPEAIARLKREVE